METLKSVASVVLLIYVYAVIVIGVGSSALVLFIRNPSPTGWVILVRDSFRTTWHRCLHVWYKGVVTVFGSALVAWWVYCLHGVTLSIIYATCEVLYYVTAYCVSRKAWR